MAGLVLRDPQSGWRQSVGRTLLRELLYEHSRALYGHPRHYECGSYPAQVDEVNEVNTINEISARAR